MDDAFGEACRLARGVVDALACGALAVDAHGVVQAANARLAAMYGAPVDALAGQPVNRLFERVEQGDLPREVLEGRASVEGEAWLLQASGGRLPVWAGLGALAGVAGCTGIRLIVVVDISGQKAAEARQHAQFAEVSRLSDTVIEQALELKHYAQQLEERVRQRTLELREANLDSIYMLAVASEAKDADTGAHVLRIQRGSEGIARELGLSARQIEEIGYSSILHDVGKMVVPDQVLRKPGALSAPERAVMEEHTLAGERILSRKPFFEMARAIARSHHENWDGSGYPDRRKGPEVPLAARIVHVADVFDALVCARVYKPAWTVEQARAFILEQSGKMFDPTVVAAFVRFLAQADGGGDGGGRYD